MNFDDQYKILLRNIIENGVEKPTRQGTKGTLSLFAPPPFKINLQEGTPILQLRKIAWKMAIREILVFISGADDLKSMLNENVPVWTDDGYKQHLKVMKERGHDPFELENFLSSMQGRVDDDRAFGGYLYPYGNNFRHFGGKYHYSIDTGNKLWGVEGVDQLKTTLENLKKDPYDRRHIIAGHNPTLNTYLPQCHMLLSHFNCRPKKLSIAERTDIKVREMMRDHYETTSNIPFMGNHITFNEKDLDTMGIPQYDYSKVGHIDFTVYQRSQDFLLGTPFNIIQAAVMLLMFSYLTGYPPGELTVNFGDVHIYLENLENCKKLLKVESQDMPKLSIEPEDAYQMKSDMWPIKSFEEFKIENFYLEGYNPVLDKLNFELIT